MKGLADSISSPLLVSLANEKRDVLALLGVGVLMCVCIWFFTLGFIYFCGIYCDAVALVIERNWIELVEFIWSRRRCGVLIRSIDGALFCAFSFLFLLSGKAQSQNIKTVCSQSYTQGLPIESVSLKGATYSLMYACPYIAEDTCGSSLKNLIVYEATVLCRPPSWWI